MYVNINRLHAQFISDIAQLSLLIDNFIYFIDNHKHFTSGLYILLMYRLLQFSSLI